MLPRMTDLRSAPGSAADASTPTPASRAPLDGPVPGAPRARALGISMSLSGFAVNQVGAALGALAFPVVGPVGVVAVRQLVTAAVLLPIARPRFTRYRAAEWWPVLGLALVFSVMNLTLYASIQRIGLGLAVTLEFLGPLAVALLTSRRIADAACALLAAAGVLVLTHPGPASDLLGIGLGLVAAAAWAGYILLNRTLGRRLPGIEGTAAASAVAALVWLPVAILWFAAHPPTAGALLLAAGCALLSSIVPYVVDLLALRRLPAGLFGILTSTSPVWAALVGWILLGERLRPAEWIGVALIVTSSAVASGLALRRAPRTAD